MFLRFTLGVLGLAGLAFPAEVSFSKDVQPLLEARCLKCHGEKMQLAKLDLRTREAALKGGEKGPAFIPNQPEQSSLYRKVAGLEKPLMPMDGKLSEAEIAILRDWIAQGAKWEGTIGTDAPKQDLSALEEMKLPEGARQFWSFRKPLKAAVPRTGEPEWDRHPVDAFLRKAMLDRGLKVAPMAGPVTLVRRAYLDLTGLPPTVEQVREYTSDTAPNAWEKLIDRLLESPRYGERWGRHWLDVARYADSNGYEHDFDRPNAWRYRDYVIQSFNKDTPFNVFLAEQIAGDELERVTNDTLIATGFLRSYAKVGFREKDNPQFRYDYLDDMIATVGRGILGLTVQCARCHNHKFDPIAQKDYYKLQASLYGYVEVDHALVPEAEAKAYTVKVKEIEDNVKPLRAAIKEMEEPYRAKLLEEKYRKWPEHIQKAVFTPEAERTPGQVLLANQIIRTTNATAAEIDRILPAAELEHKRALEARIREFERERPKAIPVAAGITDGDYRFTPDGAGDEPAPGKGIKQEVTEGSFLCDGSTPYQAPPSYFLHHGDVHSRGSVMKPGFVSVVDDGSMPAALPPAHQRTSGRRLALARWLGSSANPLTPRVMVNRIWHHHFGRGIVTSLDNLGKAGDPPTHPELLDWLAVEFVERGWSVKRMHRLLMSSRAYRLSSEFGGGSNLNTDADNLYWWKFRPQRLEAEVVRDSILFASGSLNAKMFGPAVFPELAEEVLASMDKGIWRKQKDGPEVWRRSVYVYRKRGLPLPFFEVFDLPDQNITCARRTTSTVPTQALTLLHNEWVLNQARRLADRIATTAPSGPDAQLDLGYRLALSRPPTPEERRIGLEFLSTHTLADFAHVMLNLNEFVYLR
ncbi:MAG: PSD1 domain-containing protein [Acidobacteriia bacterium]|nr:PSD1 domain-containing protein [Terriglobia bacterium]